MAIGDILKVCKLCRSKDQPPRKAKMPRLLTLTPRHALCRVVPAVQSPPYRA